MMNVKENVLQLLEQQRQTNPQAIFAAVQREVIESCQVRLGLRFPSQYREFLTFCNGAEVGEEALYGVKPKKEFFDVERRFSASPQFKEWETLPVAGDGCGNFYLLDVKDRHVYFYDTIGADQPSYVVASDFWHFAYFYISEKFERRGWPSDKAYVLEVDPNLAKPCKARPIWEKAEGVS